MCQLHATKVVKLSAGWLKNGSDSKIVMFFISCRYIGDEYGLVSVLKYDADGGRLIQLPYEISSNSLSGNLLFF